jgi:hypothetical protein
MKTHSRSIEYGALRQSRVRPAWYHGLMKSEETAGTAADEQVVRLIHHRMIDAWNASDGATFAGAFTPRND